MAAEPQLFNVMTHTNKMSYFANFRMLNRLILQFSFAKTVLFCKFLSPKPSYFAIFVIIVKFPKVRSTQFELVTNCHRLTCFYPLCFTPLFAIRSMKLEIEYTISNYLSLFLIAENGQNPIGTSGLVQCGIFQILFQL